MGKNGLCRCCGELKPLVKAHAIPRAFFDIPQQEPENYLKLVSNKEGVFPKRSPIGVYDADILCLDCEATFSDVDSYAAHLLLRSPDSFKPIPSADEPEGFEVHNYDYSRLKRFFMAVLWRAAVSDHVFYSKVDIGTHASRLLEMLRASDPGSPDDFASVLWVYDAHPISTIIFDPYWERYEGVNCYRFKLHRYLFWIKVDKRPFPSRIRDVQLSEAPPFLVLHRKFLESRDHRLARKLVKDLASRVIK